MIRSLIIQGEIESSEGELNARLFNSSEVGVNDWEFRCCTIKLSSERPLKKLVQLSCGLNHQVNWDYDSNSYQDAPTVLSLLDLNITAGGSQFFRLSEATCPWIKCISVDEKFCLYLTDVGSTKPAIEPEDNVFVVAHMWIKRVK